MSGRPLSERLGRWACGLMFVGFNVAFFPMHITGLLGMPRRVYTYPEGLGWDGMNLASTLGAFILAAGILVVLIDIALHVRITGKVKGNLWHAGTLEWLPLDNYASRSIPRVTSREPLWDNPGLAHEAESGQHYLPGSATGERETIVTSAIDARPQYVLLLPGPSWLPLVAAKVRGHPLLSRCLSSAHRSIALGLANAALTSRARYAQMTLQAALILALMLMFATFGMGLALVAIAWNGLPALLVHRTC